MIERVGIVGGGQLGRMLTEAAHPLGFQVTVVDPSPTAPAVYAGAEQIHAPLTDTDAIDTLAERSDLLTWEIEHIPAGYLMTLAAKGVQVEPSPSTLATIQDKLTQKELLDNAGIPVAPFSGNLDTFSANGPYVVKSRKGGYDGRGNLVVTDLDDPAIAEQFGDTPVYVEQKLAFEKELAVIVARGVGAFAPYPVAETIHKDNICNIVMAPAQIPIHVEHQAHEVARETMRLLNGVGVFAIEMFLVDGQVYVNEIAPRVHNSGHHTIEANATSQFEQHIRAVTGMPLGSTAMRSAAVMINILGNRDEPLSREGLERVLALPDTHPHFYGKDPRPARKVGHITVLRSTIKEAREVAEQARKELVI